MGLKVLCRPVIISIQVYLSAFLSTHFSDVVDPDIELVALLNERVEGSAGLVMLFQHEDSAAGLGQGDGGGHPAGAAADDDGVQVGGDLLDGEVLLDHLIPLALVQDVRFPLLPGVLPKRVDGRCLETPPGIKVVQFF